MLTDASNPASPCTLCESKQLECVYPTGRRSGPSVTRKTREQLIDLLRDQDAYLDPFNENAPALRNYDSHTRDDLAALIQDREERIWAAGRVLPVQIRTPRDDLAERLGQSEAQVAELTDLLEQRDVQIFHLTRPSPAIAPTVSAPNTPVRLAHTAASALVLSNPAQPPTPTMTAINLLFNLTAGLPLHPNGLPDIQPRHIDMLRRQIENSQFQGWVRQASEMTGAQRLALRHILNFQLWAIDQGEVRAAEQGEGEAEEEHDDVMGE